MGRNEKISKDPGRTAGRKQRIRRRLLAGAGIFAVACGLGVCRLTKTAEFIAAFGSDSERADLCRVVPDLSPKRQRRVLSRLLDDPSQKVRIGAVTAVGRGAEDSGLDDRLERMLYDAAIPADVRVRAGEVLLGRSRVRPAVLDYLRAKSEDERFRRACAPLVARLYERRLPGASGDDRRRLLRCTLDEADPVREYLQDVVLDHVRDFAPFRGTFLEALDREPDFETRQYVLSALSAIDGLLRGQHADDWRQQALEQLGEGQPHVYEAEWAHDIRPNYHIAEFKGALCLALGEGAGGVMHWLKGLNGTVDVATARFNLFVPEDGRYGLWARVYLDDKCGNSFGVWIDGKGFENFPDEHNVMDEWHWLDLRHAGQPCVSLGAGLHQGRLQAWEDGVYIDKLVLLPEGRRAEELVEVPAAVWDPSLNSSISFSVERQSQPRGTTQFVTVWVRRNSSRLSEGAVELKVPAPFAVVGVARRPSTARSGCRELVERHRIRFAGGNPLCRSTFRVELPEGATAGEGVMEAVYTDVGGEEVRGRLILGAQFDWLCTGPLGPDDDLQRRLSGKTTVADEELKDPWAPYPQEGYDAYRRLDFERAYGQLRNVYLYLITDIFVEKEGDYLALLTADDTAFVYVDGRLAVAQEETGPGEGRMVTRGLRLTRGRHRLFVRHYQADSYETTGPDSYRHTPNHCCFKLLLRKERHRAAESVKGLPMSRPSGLGASSSRVRRNGAQGR